MSTKTLARRALTVGLAALPFAALTGQTRADAVAEVYPLHNIPAAPTAGMVDETPQAWFVELASAPAARGTDARTLRAERQAFRANARAAGISYQERYAFEKLWNGLSINLAPTQVGRLSRLPGVKAIYPVETVAIPDPQVSVNPELFTAIQMTGADIAQNELGLTGEGIRVAVMDTGIDIDHPDLGGDGTADGAPWPTARIPYGWDFVGDDFNADPTSPSYNPNPVPDPVPDDCNGHGSHVAGIVGASGTVTGVAPGVTFGAYRVFGCEGSTTADIMIAAMERALADGMHVLNMSIGSSFQWPQYPTAAAASELVDQGMVVVTSIGNAGTSGLYAASAPGVGHNVIGTASFDNSHVFLTTFTVNDRQIGYVPMTFAGPTPTSGTEEIVFIGRACNVTSGDTLLADPSGKVALAVRGACSFGEKAAFAISSGATAVVIHNNSPGVFNGTLGAPIDGTTPVVGISLSDGEFIRAQTAPVMMTWTDQQASFPSPTGGLISSFSSYGLSPDLTVKPDIGAPGGNIYSTYPLEAGGYATISGTSMASPHVAGTAALLLQARPDTPAHRVRDIVQNSADPKNWSLAPAFGLDHVHRQGAGLVDVDDAITSTTTVTPGKIAAGEGEAGPHTQPLTIANSAASDVTYDLSYVNAISTGGTRAPGFFFSDASVAFSSASVTVPAGGSATVDATINPATGPNFGLYGGYIVLTPQGGGPVYRVPYAGFVGDYQDIVVLTPTGNNFPWLANLEGTTYFNRPDGWTYSMEGDDVPFFLVHFDHQSRLAKFDVFHASGRHAGQPVHPVFHTVIREDYMPRNSTAGGFFAFAWDGTRFHNNGRGNDFVKVVPDGDYRVRLSVLKALGDPSNPDHWETWESPIITIDRP